MALNKVEICGVNTSRLPVLSSSEKKELLKRTKQGDTDAREKLIDGNLRLVLSIIQRFAGRGGRRENQAGIHTAQPRLRRPQDAFR